jgi:hypothetical protein
MMDSAQLGGASEIRLRLATLSQSAFAVMFVVIVILLALQGPGAQAQVVNPDVPDASQSSSQRQRDNESPWTLQQKREMAKKQNVARQKDIQKDTDKLLELATELKQYVDKTNEDILSMDVVKKAEEIEKLAKTVREKMKGQ